MPDWSLARNAPLAERLAGGLDYLEAAVAGSAAAVADVAAAGDDVPGSRQGVPIAAAPFPCRPCRARTARQCLQAIQACCIVRCPHHR